MIRTTLTAAMALALAAVPVLAQSQSQPAATPGSEEWLRLRGEQYHRAPDSRQNPAEVAATARLNAEIAARNAAAEEAEGQARTAYEQSNARWREETARAETERAQWQADSSVAMSAQARWERDHAAWEAEMAACRAVAGRVCDMPPPPRP